MSEAPTEAPQGLEEQADAAREETVAAVETERGLPDSPANDNPLPLEAIDATVNKAEGDHEALAENAYQVKAVEEDPDASFNGLTSVEENMLRDQQDAIRAEGATVGDAPAEEEAKSSEESSS